MQKKFLLINLGLLLVAGGAFAQTTPKKKSFEVASVKPAAPLDPQKIQAAMANGGALPIGPKIGESRAEYTFMSLKELIAMAYKVKAYQLTGPDFITSERFDIQAKYPDGATKADAPEMLQSLLEERFKLTAHNESKERPVLALVVGKGGAKMQDSGHTPAAIDENAPLKPGETSMETPEGQVRMMIDIKNGSSTVNMGSRGTATSKLDAAAGMIHMSMKDVTMSGFADTLSRLMSQLGGGRQVVDMTDLKGHYEASLDLSLAEMMNMARAAGANIPAEAGGAGANAPGANAASDPSGGTSVNDAVAALGLKLESRKAPVEQLVIDHIEKTPIEN